MVVLPEPVGPVTSTMPLGCSTRRARPSASAWGRPSSVSSGIRLVLPSRRMTRDSPQAAGRVETRRSTSWPDMRMVWRPSCGRRRSPISMPDKSFSREQTASNPVRGPVRTVCNMPSTRIRMLKRSSNGSTWISEARLCRLSANTAFTKSMTGASSASSRRCAASEAMGLAAIRWG